MHTLKSYIASIIDSVNKRHLEIYPEINSVIHEIYSTGFVQDENGALHSHYCSSVTFQAGTLLYELVREVKPVKTLEVGMAYGLSSLFICQALADNGGGHHTAIDPYQQEIYQSIGLFNLERSNFKDMLRFLQASSQNVLPQLVLQEECFDFAFIDGSHLFDHAFVDFFYIDKMIKVGGCVVIDDIWMPSVRKVASFILKNKPYALVRPNTTLKTPVSLQATRVGRRIMQNPFGRDWTLKLLPKSVAVFKKVGIDERFGDFHRDF